MRFATSSFVRFIGCLLLLIEIARGKVVQGKMRLDSLNTERFITKFSFSANKPGTSDDFFTNSSQRYSSRFESKVTKSSHLSSSYHITQSTSSHSSKHTHTHTQSKIQVRSWRISRRTRITSISIVTSSRFFFSMRRDGKSIYSFKRRDPCAESVQELRCGADRSKRNEEEEIRH